MKSALDRLASGLKNAFNRPVPEAPPDLREKVALADVQRRLRIYLRAMWDCDFILKHAKVDSLGYEADGPFIEYSQICLPEFFYECETGGGRRITGLEIYRAAAAHAAAHIMYTQRRLSRRTFDRWQLAVIAMIEDARIETLALREFPGLKPLWAKQHTVTPQQAQCGGDYLNRLARALLDGNYRDDDPWVVQGREAFAALENLEDEQQAQTMALQLADAFRARKLKLDPQAEPASDIPYRDDNRYLWRRRGEPIEVINPYLKSRSNSAFDDGDAEAEYEEQEIVGWENTKMVMATYAYPEWNYRNQSEDAGWVTLREIRLPQGELSVVENILEQNRHLVTRMKALLRAVRDSASHRQRKLEDGDEIDINAAVRNRIDARLGRQPDPRIMMRTTRKARDISVLMLLDFSKSMNAVVDGAEHTALELTRQVSVLFAEAIAEVGDPFAIHGFSSDGRHFVEYFPLKDFGQPYDDAAKASMAGMSTRRGTRMGAAVRHATHLLDQQKSARKLLLILTDGEPSDIDAPDRRYLHDDTKKAVEAAQRDGIHTYCISLDSSADEYVARIFGAMNYIVVDHVRCLPEKVLMIYAGLTR